MPGGQRSYGTYDYRSGGGDPYHRRAAGDAEAPRSGEHSILRSGPLNKNRVRINVLEIIFVPWILLSILLVAFLYAGQRGQVFILFLMPIVLCILSVGFTIDRYFAQKQAEVVLGVLCIVAICAACIVGTYANLASLQEYWRLGLGASYFNVLPSEPAGGKIDATTLEFTDTSRVDAMRTYGFVDGRSLSGTIYCVAPIASGDSSADDRSSGSKIQYWAAGTDCCYPRDNFNCGEASNDGAHGAIWFARDSNAEEKFQLAVDGAEKAYGIQAGENRMLVKWVQDPLGYRRNLWNRSVTLFLVFGGVYLFISVMIGVAMMSILKQ